MRPLFVKEALSSRVMQCPILRLSVRRFRTESVTQLACLHISISWMAGFPPLEQWIVARRRYQPTPLLVGRDPANGGVVTLPDRFLMRRLSGISPRRCFRARADDTCSAVLSSLVAGGSARRSGRGPRALHSNGLAERTRRGMEREELLAHARAAALRAYAPYSGFRVGAAVALAEADGERIVTGANVENASYGLTVCAERVALAAALTSRTFAPGGEEDSDVSRAGSTVARPRITHIAVACIDTPADAPASQRTPCGACRQWLAELAADAVYYIDGLPGEMRLDDLLPHAFRVLPPGSALRNG